MFDFFEDFSEAVLELPEAAARGDDEAIFALVAIVLLLVGGAAAVATHTWLQARGQSWRVDVRRVLSSAAAFLWLIPVLGVVGVMVARYVDRHEPPRSIAPAGGDAEVASTATTVESHELDSAESHEAPAADGSTVSTSTSNPDDALPEWLDDGAFDDGRRSLVTIHSARFATVQEAERDALLEALAVLQVDVERADPRMTDLGPIPLELVERSAVRRRFVEGPIRLATPNTEFDVYRVHLQIELSDEVRGEVRPFWRAAIVGDRLWGLVAGVAFLTIAFGTLAGYLRLDDLSGGRYRTRLRFAAASLVTAGGLVAAVLL